MRQKEEKEEVNEETEDKLDYVVETCLIRAELKEYLIHIICRRVPVSMDMLLKAFLTTLWKL